MIYLACPHTSFLEDEKLAKEEEQLRFEAITHVAGKMLANGQHCFSPITHTHPIQQLGHCSEWGTDSWLNLDDHFIDMCTMLVVVKMPGWAASEGVNYEIAKFYKQNKPVVEMELLGNVPDDLRIRLDDLKRERDKALGM